ncbi:MAG: DUF3560 domain-containing protein [Pseudomonadales bacterium]
MHTTQSITDAQGNDQQSSLRGEAPQVHGVKGKSKKASREARQALIKASRRAKAQIELIAAAAGEEFSVNEMLIINYQEKTGCNTFKTFHGWKQDGYRVKKGETAFRVWGKPLKAKQPQTGDDDEESTFKLFPMCCLFNESQVEKEGEATPHDRSSGHPDSPPPSATEKPVKVAKFCDGVAHLERTFNVDRHACVGVKERRRWQDICQRVLAEVESLKCPRAKPDDLARQESQTVYKRAKDMAPVIPFGQPILVGHHSEHRDRRYRDRIHNTFVKPLLSGPAIKPHG